ncbi:putative metal-binding motif-containing protein [Patescibacteria group bacterium]|nr:putative metal-binding motif-containing protein [Patescibacteria group bacterium]MBU1673419.1 putative metal-binding motif-containing protein [Patescibacteria group bacterium]MBU1963323.1 putative metal-binding motif-containing protein [Patescibacteria group bacterium]
MRYLNYWMILAALFVAIGVPVECFGIGEILIKTSGMTPLCNQHHGEVYLQEQDSSREDGRLSLCEDQYLIYLTYASKIRFVVTTPDGTVAVSPLIVPTGKMLHVMGKGRKAPKLMPGTATDTDWEAYNAQEEKKWLAVGPCDADADGYIDDNFSNCARKFRKRIAADGPDCDDGDNLTHPGQAESCDDGVDNDCDGNIDGVDNDCASFTADIAASAAAIIWDEPDEEPSIYESAAPRRDDDADASYDNDGDGTPAKKDCDDFDPALNREDRDGDMFTSCDGDCNDRNSEIYPGNEEICGNGIDDNCNGRIDESPCFDPIAEATADSDSVSRPGDVETDSDARADDRDTTPIIVMEHDYFRTTRTEDGYLISLMNATLKGDESNFRTQWMTALTWSLKYLEDHPFACVEVGGCEDSHGYDPRAESPANTDEWWVDDEQTMRYARADNRRIRIQQELETLAAEDGYEVSMEQIRKGESLLRASYRGGQLKIINECLARPEAPRVEYRERVERVTVEVPGPTVTKIERSAVGIGEVSLGLGVQGNNLDGLFLFGGEYNGVLYPAIRIEFLFDELTHVFRWGGFLEMGPAVRGFVPNPTADRKNKNVMASMGGGLKFGFELFPEQDVSPQIDFAPIAITSGGWTGDNFVRDFMWGAEIQPTMRFGRVRFGADVRVSIPNPKDKASENYYYRWGIGGFVLIDLVTWRDLSP